MVYVLIGTLAVQSLAWILLQDRQTTKHAAQVADLCQRLQAPDTAVAQHVLGTDTYEPQHLPFDDDGAWMAYVGDQPLIGMDDLG